MSGRGRIIAVGLCMGMLTATVASGYDGRDHQFLTFLAAKQFNRCVADTDIPPLTPLQVRYMAKANAGLAERSVFARMFNWRYYDADHSEHSLMWLVDTRFYNHFAELAERIPAGGDSVDAYQDLGRLLSYVQMVTSPARAVPVYAARFWRLSFSDRFDGYPLDEEALTASVEVADCDFLEQQPESYAAVLSRTAGGTLDAVRAPIDGLPAKWTAFWKPSRRPDNFGDYGPAGNSFGRRTEFRCGNGQRCVLLNDDPLYREFALARHRDAVRGTQSAMLLMQSGIGNAVTSAR